VLRTHQNLYYITNFPASFLTGKVSCEIQPQDFREPGFYKGGAGEPKDFSLIKVLLRGWRSNRKMMKVCNRDDSFTLVEILIVLAIVTIVAIATVPRISTALDTVRFRGTVSGLVTFLRDAHLEAILRRRETVVTINFKENTLKIDDDKQFTLPPEMTLEPEKKDGHDSKYRFFYNGRGSGPRIQVIGKNKRKAVVFVDLLSGLSEFDLR